MRAESWVSAHLFHAGDLDAMITELVPPLAAELTPRGLFFLRYWEGGSHLRLRLLPKNAEHAWQVKGELTRRARAYLIARPSVRTMTEDEYRAMASRQAEGERLPGHDVRLYANDSVEFIPYQPEHHAYGDEACLSAVESHFTESSGVALDILGACPAQARRSAIALATLTLTMAAIQPDPAGLARVGAKTPPSVLETHRERGHELLGQTRGLWAGGANGTLGDWSESIRRLRRNLTALGCAPVDAGSPLGFLSRTVPPERRAVAEVLLRCTHLLNNRLGLTLGVEFHLALLAARLLSDLATTGELT